MGLSLFKDFHRAVNVLRAITDDAKLPPVFNTLLYERLQPLLHKGINIRLGTWTPSIYIEIKGAQVRASLAGAYATTPIDGLSFTIRYAVGGQADDAPQIVLRNERGAYWIRLSDGSVGYQLDLGSFTFRPYGPPVTPGQTIKGILDFNKRTLSYEIDGVKCRVPFEDVNYDVTRFIGDQSDHITDKGQTLALIT